MHIYLFVTASSINFITFLVVCWLSVVDKKPLCQSLFKLYEFFEPTLRRDFSNTFHNSSALSTC